MTDNSYVYIMSNDSRSVLYVGVTSNLERRANEHKSHAMPNSFTKKYNCVHLVYFEEFGNIEDAIAREKVLKGWSRKKKDCLIASVNPELRDLSDFSDVVLESRDFGNFSDEEPGSRDFGDFTDAEEAEASMHHGEE